MSNLSTKEAAKRVKETPLTQKQKMETIKRINDLYGKGKDPSGSPIAHS